MRVEETYNNRNSNLELFRIVTMLLIVAHHYVVNSGLLPIIAGDYPSAKSIFLLSFGWAGKTGIDCFVLITGYFMCTSHITLRKGLKLLLWIEFYRIVFFSIFVAAGYIELSPKAVFKGLSPIAAIKDGFVACYLVFFCFIPFVNILIKALSKKQHLTLVGLCLLMYSVVPQMGMQLGYNYVGWFIVVYLIAAYLRLYPPQWSCNVKYMGFASLCLVVLSLVSIVGGAEIFMFFGKKPDFYFFVEDSNKPLAIATAVSTFLFFKNIRMKHCKMINAVAASAFGVLLIHANSDAMRQWLWKDTLKNVEYYAENVYLHAIMCVLVIYVVCTLLDVIRYHLLEKPFFKWLDKFLQ